MRKLCCRSDGVRQPCASNTKAITSPTLTIAPPTTGRGRVAETVGKGNRAAIRAALDAIGPERIPPLVPMLTCPEPTYEGMCRLLAMGQPSIGIFSAEGGQFVGGHGMSDDARLRTAAGLSAAWDGEPIRRVRVGDGIRILPGRRVSLHLMLQPEVANIWLSDQLLIGQGLLSRTLFTAPDSAMGGRLSHDEAPETAPAMARYGARLLEMLERPLPLGWDEAQRAGAAPAAVVAGGGPAMA